MAIVKEQRAARKAAKKKKKRGLEVRSPSFRGRSEATQPGIHIHNTFAARDWRKLF